MIKIKEILLGATSGKNLVFGNFEVRTTNGFQEFSATFDEVSPFINTFDYKKERAESLIECMDKKWTLDRLEQYDCRPSELAEIIANNLTIEDLEDISLYPESYRVEGLEDSVYFSSCGCGQHDCREELLEGKMVSKAFIEKLHDVWDKYHLKEIPNDVVEDLLSLYDEVYEEFDKELWIQRWLEFDVYPIAND